MERAWLEARLAEGRSNESIAKDVEKHPSTVAYWVKKHGLRSQHAPKHAARGGVARETLLELVERGLSVRQIGEKIGLGSASVRHWLAKYELQTDPLHYARRDGEKPPSVPRECPRHGWTDYVRSGERGFYRCPRCAMERVAARRRRIKEILVAESRRSLPRLRVRHLHRRPPIPPPGPEREAVHGQPRRHHRIA